MTRMLVQKSGSAGFSLAVSTLLAGSVGFALFAMPQPLFEAIVEASGLSNLLSAAEPPLGETARLAAVALGAGLAFAAAWLVLRLFDGSARAELSEVEWDAPPRLRRADAHPDAPARRPFLAGQELGEPQDYPSPLKVKAAAGLDEAASPFGTETIVSAEADWAPMTVVETEQEEAADAVSRSDEPDAFEETLELGPELVMDDAPEAAPASLPALEEAIDPVAGEPLLEEAAPVSAEMPVWPLSRSAPEATNDALMARLALPDDRGGSISSLMQRLDHGLAKVEWPLRTDGQMPPRPKDEVADELRSALDDLQRIAGGRS